METKLNRKPDPNSPMLLLCLMCDNIFYGNRAQVFLDPVFYPKVNRDCPICGAPRQLLGAHPGAWGGTNVSEKVVEPLTS